jgi:hypothetical protein
MALQIPRSPALLTLTNVQSTASPGRGMMRSSDLYTEGFFYSNTVSDRPTFPRLLPVWSQLRGALECWIDLP